MNEFYPIQRAEMEGFLCNELGFVLAQQQVGHTLSYEHHLVGAYGVVVYSTIDARSGVAVDVGESAIRVVILKAVPSQPDRQPTGFPWGWQPRAANGQKSAIWCARTATWRQNLWRCLRQAVASVLEAPLCDRCQMKCEPRSTRDHARWWWGCGTWSETGCKGGAGDMDIERWKTYLGSVKDQPVPESLSIIMDPFMNDAFGFGASFTPHAQTTAAPAVSAPPVARIPDPPRGRRVLVEEYGFEGGTKGALLRVYLRPEDSFDPSQFSAVTVQPAVLPPAPPRLERAAPIQAPVLEEKHELVLEGPARVARVAYGFPLNEDQAVAVAHVEGPARVSAAAGSGKTAVVAVRITDLVRVHGVRPEQIVAFTFTKKGAKEMRDRLQQILGPQATNVWISTIHRFCWHWLKELDPDPRLRSLIGSQECSSPLLERAGITSALAIVKTILRSGTLSRYDRSSRRWEDVTDERGRKIKLIEKGLWLQEPVDAGPFMRGIQLLHAYMVGPQASPAEMREVVERLADPQVSEHIPRVYRAYEAAKELLGCIAFEDMITEFLRRVVGDPEKVAALRSRYAHCIVDEGQDLSRAQQEVAFGIMERPDGTTGNLVLTGDYRQTLFSFAGAYPENFRNFPARCNARVLALRVNYRSSRVIVQMGDRLAKANGYEEPPTVWVHPEAACVKPVVAKYADQTDEANAVAGRIFSRLEESGFSPDFNFRDHAVLARMNSQLGPIQIALLSRGINFQVPRRANFFDLRVVKACLGYLRAIHSAQLRQPVRGEDIADCAGLPRRGLGEAFCSKIRAHQGDALAGCMEIARHESKWSSAADLAELIQDAAWDHKTREPRSIQAAWEVISTAVLSQGITEGRVNDADDADPEALMTFSEVATRFHWPEIGRFLEMADQAQRLSVADDDDPAARNLVTVSTCHSSKGGQWKYVYGIGLAENILPHFRALELESGEEEERNIAYVLVTRAKTHLYLSWPEQAFRQTLAPSRFLFEALVAGEGLEELQQAAGRGREERKNSVDEVERFYQETRDAFVKTQGPPEGVSAGAWQEFLRQARALFDKNLPDYLLDAEPQEVEEEWQRWIDSGAAREGYLASVRSTARPVVTVDYDEENDEDNY